MAPRPGGAPVAGLLLLLLLPPWAPALPVPGARGCAAPCFCFATPDTLQCRLGRLLEPPADLPASVRNLSIAGANLTVLRPGAFAGGWAGGAAARPLAALTLLLLAHDAIEALQGAAFAGLPALATLDLSHNRLRAVAPDAFAGCARLRTLRLNQALAPDARALDRLLGAALTNLSLARLEVAGNALRQLPALAALPPSLRLLDARNNSLQAVAAAQLEGPRPARASCWHGTRPKVASYVFFGIVLIGFVFLTVLYLNCKGIKRWRAGPETCEARWSQSQLCPHPPGEKDRLKWKILRAESPLPDASLLSDSSTAKATSCLASHRMQKPTLFGCCMFLKHRSESTRSYRAPMRSIVNREG
uniref:Uncharacterized protein n=1 Tax=Sphaerodactylus townsendi TaxID=933632 RepID=A0ACB8FFE0_9SAUR